MVRRVGSTKRLYERVRRDAAVMALDVLGLGVPFVDQGRNPKWNQKGAKTKQETFKDTLAEQGRKSIEEGYQTNVTSESHLWTKINNKKYIQTKRPHF